MSKYRDILEKDENMKFTFKDYQELIKLLESNILTDKQKKALEHLFYYYDYTTS